MLRSSMPRFIGALLLFAVSVSSAAAREPQPALTTAPATAPPELSSDVQLDQTLIDPRIRPDDLPPAEFLRRFSAFLDKPTVTQPINPVLFRDFWLKWGLVTTRYKPDGDELRFTYANKIAAEALAKGEYPFPEGAVLAKIGAKAVHDPGFNSSLVPGPIMRIQVMLKKAKDPNARDGWVYALYTAKYRGALTGDEINACHACHLMVPERDMVFSEPFPVAFGATLAALPANEPLADKFVATPIDKLKPYIKETLQHHDQTAAGKVMVLEMPLFTGTLFESREILSRLVRRNQQTYIMSNPEGTIFALYVPDANEPGCLTVINTIEGSMPLPITMPGLKPRPQVPAHADARGKPPTATRRSCETP